MSVKRNIIANFSGSAWAALMSLVFAPFYIKLLGMESFGIIGVFTTLAGILSILDLGLSQAMNREMARLSATPGQEKLTVDTAWTLELSYWFVAAGVVLVLLLVSGFIANHWLNPEHLSRESIREALWIMAVVVGLRWPIAIYTGGLNGLQRQVSVNVFLVVFATLQGAGALAVLWFIEPTLKAFFIWHALVALMQVVILRRVFWRGFPREPKARFQKPVLRSVWQFAAGMTGISVMATILTQLDKVLLSRFLSLTDFGYYAFATTVAMVLFRLVGPVFNAYYPQLTALVSKGDEQVLSKTFHEGCQLMAVIVLPISLVIAFFSWEILSVWTRNPVVVSHTYLLVSLLVMGNAVNGLMHMPYALQLSHGWTKLALYQNVIAVIILIPALYFAARRWGATGAAVVWILLNCGYLIVGVQFMFRRLLVAEKSKWYMNDIAKILISVLLVLVAARFLFPETASDLATAVFLASTLGLAMLLALVSADSLNVKSAFSKAGAR